ncbi:MAG: SDR family oxidoreductase [Anaerolineae bacterium]
MRTSISDKIALVTGASRGIGRASAVALAQEGAHVIVAARTASELDTLADEIRALGREALPVACDVSQTADVDRLFEQAVARFGRVDILINNAGAGKYGPVDALTPEDYDWMMDTNMRSTFLCTRKALPGMKERRDGHIVFVGSVSGLKGTPNQAVYSATKHAQHGFATALDAECREYNVKVSYLAPGGTSTHFAFGMGRIQGDPKLEQYLDPEDVAEAVVFAVTQPLKARAFLIGVRPMRESL